jgi:hypothetical chaperone protein
MHTFCGLDFGTSNSTIGIYKNNQCQLVPLEGNKPTMRSAIFCDSESKRWEFGQSGISHYLEGTPGRLMMALKSVLGSSLMDDKTLIFDELIPYSSVLKHFMKHLKLTAEASLGKELTQVVLGRPVHFHDHDQKKDLIAQQTLEKIARELGFNDVLFQYEPIAAALSYETTIKKEQLALIIDMGGGTSDITLIRLRPGVNTSDRSHDVLANCGIHIAGTDFDKKLSLHSVMPLLGMGSMMRGSSSDIVVPVSYYYDLTTWHLLNSLYDAKTIAHLRSIQSVAYEKYLIERLIHVLKRRSGHQILNSVESVKQRLSDSLTEELDLSFIEDALHVLLTQKKFNEIIDDDLQEIISTVQEAVKIAKINPTEISAIFYTGGSTKIPFVREKVTALFPAAEVIQGDAFGSVGMGLTIDAERRYS